jgi:hypothetical protein
MKKCKLCKEPAKWYEWSPDGETDFFCSKRHWKINRDYLWAKGFHWRASALQKLTKEKEEYLK